MNTFCHVSHAVKAILKSQHIAGSSHFILYVYVCIPQIYTYRFLRIYEICVFTLVSGSTSKSEKNNIVEKWWNAKDCVTSSSFFSSIRWEKRRRRVVDALTGRLNVTAVLIGRRVAAPETILNINTTQFPCHFNRGCVGEREDAELRLSDTQ